MCARPRATVFDPQVTVLRLGDLFLVCESSAHEVSSLTPPREDFEIHGCSRSTTEGLVSRDAAARGRLVLRIHVLGLASTACVGYNSRMVATLLECPKTSAGSG